MGEKTMRMMLEVGAGDKVLHRFVFESTGPESGNLLDILTMCCVMPQGLTATLVDLTDATYGLKEPVHKR